MGVVTTDDHIRELAERAECPPGWYEGPWFDNEGEIHAGIPPCLRKLVELIQEEL